MHLGTIGSDEVELGELSHVRARTGLACHLPGSPVRYQMAHFPCAHLSPAFVHDVPGPVAFFQDLAYGAFHGIRFCLQTKRILEHHCCAEDCSERVVKVFPCTLIRE